jgi:pimeloyl-ACP methyl ester carboxylesterase
MSTIMTRDEIKIAYKDWGEGQPILFSHGWPLAGDAWEAQMLFFGENGDRVIAHDRRSHGKSDQPWDGNNMDQYADDLAELIQRLDLNNLVLVGHPTGGGEVAHYIGRHGSKRVAKVVLVGAVPPLMLKTSANLEGIVASGKSPFDGRRQAAVIPEASVEMRGPDVEHELSAEARPPHLAVLAHALVDQLIDGGSAPGLIPGLNLAHPPWSTGIAVRLSVP